MMENEILKMDSSGIRVLKETSVLSIDVKVLLDDGAYMPEKAHSADAGFDLFSPGDFVIPPTTVNEVGSATINTGVHMQIPCGFVGMIKSKSGLNVKHGLTAEGVVDAGYTGSIVVKIYNHTRDEYKISRGDKLTQIVILPIPEVSLIEVDNLDDTERGAEGFGSTGK